MVEQPTDPELLRQLDDARTSGGTVEAVLRLERQPGERPVPSVVRDQADRAIRRATEACGETPADVHVMAISHAEFGPWGLRWEWILFDETAIWKQILLARPDHSYQGQTQ